MPLDTSSIASEQAIKSPLAMLYSWESNAPQQTYLTQPVNGQYHSYTWKQVATMARQVAARLLDMGIEPGSRISIFSKNTAEWFITDLGIMMAGMVSVPIFSTAGPDTIKYVLEHSDAKAIFIGKLDDTQRQAEAVPESVTTIAFPYPNIPADIKWEDFIDIAPMQASPLPDMDSVMTIIYTSGSTGKPKGVVHSFRTICWAAQNSVVPLTVQPGDRIMSYLPLAHITERVIVELSSFYSGAQISFVESLDTFVRDVQNFRPTLFVSVPRLWTKFQLGVLAKMPQQKLDFMLKIPILGGLVAKKIRKGLGLDQARLWASGSAPLAPVVIEWFTKIGINISEGWGMTENSAYGTGSVPFRQDKIGCIGQAYAGVDIRIADDGEIQVKAPCNMVEYYLDPEKTAEVFTDDRYLRTGDKGEIDADGYVRITGRLKDIFKTSKGKYVTPQPIESKLMENSVIEQVCVTGSNLPQPVALLVLSEEGQKLSKDELSASLSKTFDTVNASLESHQVMSRMMVMDEPWTIENDLLTPTLKVKRHVLEERFEDIIQGSHKDKINWV